MPQGIDPCTNLALYADDTKIWRKIVTSRDIALLQKDIDYLHKWSINNKMNFHPKKCKVLSINHHPSPLSMLPFVEFHYNLGENLLEYADNEKDLGVDITLFHKIVYNLIPVQLPDYLSLFNGLSRLRSCHLDRLSYVSSVLPRGKNCKILKKSLFYRGHLLWNELPLEIREIRCQTTFKFRVRQHLWTLTFDEFSNTELDISLSDGIT